MNDIILLATDNEALNPQTKIAAEWYATALQTAVYSGENNLAHVRMGTKVLLFNSHKHMMQSAKELSEADFSVITIVIKEGEQGCSYLGCNTLRKSYRVCPPTKPLLPKKMVPFYKTLQQVLDHALG